MRFSLFELFAWTTFLAICCALVLSSPLGEQILTPRPIMIGWIAAIILVQQCFSWRVALGASVFVGICVGFVGSLIDYTNSRTVNSLSLSDFIKIGIALHVFYGAMVWAAVAVASRVVLAFKAKQ